MSRAIDLLYIAKQNQIEIVLNKEKLQLKIPKNRDVNKQLLRDLSENKDLLIDFLKDHNTSGKGAAKIRRLNGSFLDPIPLSFSQERLWFIDKLEGSVQYHMPAVLQLQGKLNLSALQQALHTIVSRHQVLRTVIRENEGLGYQHILNENNFSIEVTDGFHFKENPEALPEYVADIVKAPFDLSADYMLRANLINISAEVFVLIVTMHHIASDGWSMSVVVKEFVELYSAFIEGRPAILPDLPVQYSDYAIWQRTHLTGELWDQKIAYWKNKLEGVLPLQLPTDYARPLIQSTHGAVFKFKIDKHVSGQLHDLSRRSDATLFMTLLAAFNVLLHRYSGQQDICIGTPTANRMQTEVEDLIGFFVNTLALRSQVDSEATYTELLHQVMSTTLEAYEHQEVPFEKVVDTVVKERDMSRNPLFQVMFVLQNTPDIPELTLGDMRLSGLPAARTTAKFELTLTVTETAHGLGVAIEYCTNLFNEQTIERMAGHYKNLLTAIAADPERKIGLLPMLTDAEEQQLLSHFNNTSTDYPKDKTIIDLFEEQVAKTPDNIAVCFEGQQLTYTALNERSNQLAHYLQSRGVGKEMLVPICIERGLEMIIGILGILKVGGAYVPIDPDYPEDRISFMLEDIAATIILTSKQSRIKLSGTAITDIIELDNNENLQHQPVANLQTVIEPNNLAYIIYTSGSTGRPKGVMIEHRNVVRLFKTGRPLYDFDEQDVWSMFHSFCFDFSVWEMYGALLYGGRLVVVPLEVTKDASLFSELISREGVTVLNQTPLAFYNLQSFVTEKVTPTSVRYVIFGGEALNPSKLHPWKTLYPACRMINMYGITETTVHVTFQEITRSHINNTDSIIGKPIPTLSIYILDGHLNTVPIGVAGEMYVAGAGLARGYLHLHDLTAQKFISNPFSKEPGERMYKTGDLGRWLPDGTINYLGRIDTQVKIRGYRIELGEIENVLQESGSVKQAVVIARGADDGTKQLVGYVVADHFDREAIILYLRSKLPEYMVPMLWVKLENLPLTTNGKIDRKALPDADADELINNVYVAPRNDTEKALAETWQELLGIEQIGIYDNFFELGGHSLLAMRVVSAIRKKLQVEIAIRSLFQHPTIAALAEQMQTPHQGLVLPAINVLPRPAHIPLSFSQERLWFIDRLQGSVQYHIPAVLRLKGAMDVTALSHALRQIIHRHEVLRTVIREEEGTGYQFVKEAAGWHLQIADGSHYKEDPNGLQQYIKSSVAASFNLSADYMLRAALIRVDEDDHILVATLHHIAADGWSISILVNELSEFYNAYVSQRTVSLTPLPVQYADYAIWQRTNLQGEEWEKKLGYWKGKLEAVTQLQLPTDFSRPPVQSTNGAITAVRIEKALTDQLNTLSRQQGTTLFMTLLAAFNVLLHRYSGQQDICIGTPIAGRQQQELERLIGFFVNTLALRCDVDGNNTFENLLQQVKRTTLEAYEHQEVPFEKVVDMVVKQRDMSRSPLFQVMLVLQNTPEVQQLQLGSLQLFRQASGLSAHTTALFDLLFNVAETEHGLTLAVEYCTDLYLQQTVKRMMAHLVELLYSVVKAPQQTIATLPMLSGAEEDQLLITFNNTVKDYPKDKSIIDLFEAQVERTPEALAVILEEKQLSYHELNRRSNQLANYLKTKGVTAETLVPLCVERSPEMIIAVLAILKTGAAYVPIDAEYPAERIAYILEDVKAPLVITNRENVISVASSRNKEIINLATDWPLISKEPSGNLQISKSSDSLVYMLYTSGSTGMPKGVRMPEKALTNLLNWQQKQFVNTDRRVLQFASLNFDVSFQEIFSTLCFGSRLYLINEDRRIDMVELVKDINQYRLTHLFLPYIVLKSLAEYTATLPHPVSSLQELMIAGEQLKLTNDIRQLLSSADIKLVNQYGPTEAHVVSSYTINAGSNVADLPPIGQPIDNTFLYILANQCQLVPIGVAGEIFIGGVQVASGYLNRDELTAEKFVADPFSKVAGAKMYRTGDLGRWLPDGNIEYLGRMDEQVKIRGYRIELGEIESILQQSELVSKAVLIAKEDNSGNKNLVAYVVPTGLFDRQALMVYLKHKLPEYMVPALWVKMDQLPVTGNGKIDKKALPDPESSRVLIKEYEAPRNELEIALAGIWQDLLNVDRIGIHDNFFDLGGHSLHAVRLVWQMRKKMNVNVRINDVFIHPTIAGLTGNIINKVQNPSLPDVNIKYLVPIKTSGYKPPLYIVAGGGGTALKVKQFADLLHAEQPVYVFQPPFGDDDIKGFPDTIKGIATTFIEELLLQNPTGPYNLSGHCIGGIIAFEMAQQLQIRGKEVHSLIMLDTIIRRKEQRVPGTLKNLYHIPQGIQRSLSRLMLKVDFQTFLLRKHGLYSIRYRLDNFRTKRDRLKRKELDNDLEYAGLEIFDESSEVYIAATRNHKLSLYNGEIILFYATERYFFFDVGQNIRYRKIQLSESTKNNWKEYAAGIVIHEIKGEHSNMFDPIHGDEFAQTLQKHLDNP